ncbi:hypothetical protein VP01_2271g2 [Puccinia sorghi]|uniref:Uncharacterized protein n=1 Tax=Puccinia sorghi TaxID=27349 RepID=A0A0L6V8Y5_9BASI|nr:hypothetical protein VP01_2271g2 [Puccinia sorghi]
MGLSEAVMAIFQPFKKYVSPSVLNSDVVGIISKRVWDGQIERLNAILHDVNSLKDTEVEFSIINSLIHELQKNIFQTVDYMYKQEMISAKALKEFFQLKNTFEVAALNIDYNPEEGRVWVLWDKHFGRKNPISTFNKWNCANYRNLYENKKALNHEETHQYSEIRTKVKALIEMFHNSAYEPSRNSAFFVLDFIRRNYGFEMLDVQTGEQFQEKMDAIFSRFQLLAELENITRYMEIRGSSEWISTDNNTPMGGEVVMIYKYYHLLLPKIEYNLSQKELVNSFQNNKLDEEKHDIIWRIDKILSFNKYHSLKIPPHSLIK